MLTPQNQLPCRQFRRPIILSGSTEAHCYFAEIRIDEYKVSHSLLELIATGKTVTPAFQDSRVNVFYAHMMGKYTLEGAIYASMSDLNYAKIIWPGKTATKASYIDYPVYFRGLCRAELDKYIVFFSTKEVKTPLCTPHQLVERARQKLTEYHDKKQNFEEQERLKEEEQKKLVAGKDADYRRAIELGNIWNRQRPPDPILDGVSEISGLHRAVVIPESFLLDEDNFSEPMKQLIENNGLLPPRDGNIHAVSCRDPFSETQDLQTVAMWREYFGATTYADIRWSTLTALPECFSIPLRQDTDPPFISVSIDRKAPSGVAQSNDIDFDDCRLDDSDYKGRIKRSKDDRLAHGFEALGWYQTHHIWEESSWGIYIEAERLDDFALAIFDDLRSSKISNAMTVASRLAVGLLYSHEFFHAHVDAILTWLELISGSPKHENYKLNCYQKTQMTSDWLEEALANWSAWQWFQSWLSQKSFTTDENAAITRVIETHLDCGPPGYSNWRSGNDIKTINRFAYQLVQSREPSLGNLSGLALDSLVLGQLPFVFEKSEVPVHWVGSGDIRTCLDRCPSSLNTITKKEAEYVLKTNDCKMKGSGGKGSHQKWECPDNRTFQLPKGKDLSGKVFKNLLDFLGLDKAEYIEKYR